MSAQKYRYGHRPEKRRPRKLLGVLAGAFVVVGLLGALVVRDIAKNNEGPIEGESRTVSQVLSGISQQKKIDEPFFSFELPADWKETERMNHPRERSISWQAGKEGQDNRYLKLYIDTIPSDRAVNHLVPVSAQGRGLSVGDASENCATFTGGGTLDAGRAARLKPAPAKWQDVDFICNLPRVTDREVGIGSRGGMNYVELTGSQGTHKYFFLYTDRNVQPDYNIFYEVLRSFKAK
jgi:hypothetical protein